MVKSAKAIHSSTESVEEMRTSHDDMRKYVQANINGFKSINNNMFEPWFEQTSTLFNNLFKQLLISRTTLRSDYGFMA